jgi:hypothetical protein
VVKTAAAREVFVGERGRFGALLEIEVITVILKGGRHRGGMLTEDRLRAGHCVVLTPLQLELPSIVPISSWAN